MKRNISGIFKPFYGEALNDPYQFDENLTAVESTRPPCIKMWESEIQFMARLADKWGEIETGGDLYGLKGHDDSIVIMLATPPGSNAIHEHAHFRQDIEYLNKNNQLLEGIYGLAYEGNHHNHHELSIKGVSGGDVQNIHAIAKRNGYKHMCQIVLTFEDPPNKNHNSHNYFKAMTNEQQEESESGTNLFGFNQNRSGHTRQGRYIRIHSFIYPDAEKGQPMRCPINIIPGVSPFRQMLYGNPDTADLVPSFTFPMSRILLDSFTSPQDSDDLDFEVPIAIEEQFSNLPEKVQSLSNISFRNGITLLSMPAQGGKLSLFVSYNREAPDKIHTVHLLSHDQSKGKAVDVTEEALCFGPFTPLYKVYEKFDQMISNRLDYNQALYSDDSSKKPIDDE